MNTQLEETTTPVVATQTTNSNSNAVSNAAMAVTTQTTNSNTDKVSASALPSVETVKECPRPQKYSDVTCEYLNSLSEEELARTIMGMAAQVLKHNAKENGLEWCSSLIRNITFGDKVTIANALIAASKTAEDCTEEEWLTMMRTLKHFSERNVNVLCNEQRGKFITDFLYSAGEVLTAASQSFPDDFEIIKNTLNTLFNFYKMPSTDVENWYRMRRKSINYLSHREYYYKKEQLFKMIEEAYKLKMPA